MPWSANTITFDCVPQFTSSLWFQTTAYPPASNSAVKRLHRHLKDALRARAATATWSEELPFVLLGLREQPREDTGLSPAEAVFSAPIVLPNVFLQNNELSVNSIIKIFFQNHACSAFFFAGTILAPSCPARCQPSCSLPPSSGSVRAASFHPFSRSMTAPMRFCAVAPAPPPSKLGHGIRWSLSAIFRPTQQQMPRVQPASPRQTAGLMPRQSCRNQAGLVFRPADFFTFFLFGAATKRSRNRLPTRRGGFFMPGTGSTLTASTDAVPVPSKCTAQEV
jgi:hypothetical protein